MAQEIRSHSNPVPADWWDREDNWEDFDEDTGWAFVANGITTIYCNVLAVVQIRDKVEV